MTNGITIAYSGVHQAYQLALAAHEIGQLDRFYCSLYATAGKWGGLLAGLLGADALRNRAIDGLPRDKVVEFPWPLVSHRWRARLRHGKSKEDWAAANAWFDRRVARSLRTSSSMLFVGVETCAAESFSAARHRNMIRVLDCPGIDAEFLDRMAERAAAEFGLNTESQADSSIIRDMKARELELADAILACSEFQAAILRKKISPSMVLFELPLWVDGDFWQPAAPRSNFQSGPLRVLYAGKINIRKGVPYLLRAVKHLGRSVRLTLVGNLSDEVTPMLNGATENFDVLTPCAKSALRALYQQHDLLVLPSLGDSFGFVAMEAMACGLPVIVTENCGVPVPDNAWRVPAMNADALAARLSLYAGDRELCREHGRTAAAFARRFTPQRYRRQVQEIFHRLLSPTLHGDQRKPGDSSFHCLAHASHST
jgi:glycosyltransferase involved in cell wall biosynthesis